MLKQRQQGGFTLLEIIVVLTIVSIGIAWGGSYVMNHVQPRKQVERVAHDLRDIQVSATRFYLDQRTWPSSINELMISDYYVGNTRSLFDDEYVVEQDGDALFIRVDMPSERLSRMLVSQVVGSIRNDSTDEVTLRMVRPSDASIQNYFLARRPVPGCPDCNTLQTDINFDGFDIIGAGELTAESVMVDEAEIDDLQVLRLATEAVLLGNNSITYSGGRLVFNAGSTEFSGDIHGGAGQFSSVQSTGPVSGREFTGTDFRTSLSSTNDNRALLNSIQAQWAACQAEGGCQ